MDGLNLVRACEVIREDVAHRGRIVFGGDELAGEDAPFDLGER
jgi:hypothetical protein